MLQALQFERFTVFRESRFEFGKNLNLIVGENGSGKSHVIKAVYAAIAANARHGRNGSNGSYDTKHLQGVLAEKLVGVFRPEALGRLVRRVRGRSYCRIACSFDESKLDLTFSFSNLAQDKVVVEVAPGARQEKMPVFLPTRELLTVAPGFVSLYETTHLPFEETWRDACLLLGAPLAKGRRDKKIHKLLLPLEVAMGGSLVVDTAGRFFLNTSSGSFEMHLVAEGMRKLAMVARLIATGSLLDKGYLFWDEPESNLNPKLIKTVAKTILQIANNGVQVFIATHSLFLLRELYILQAREYPHFQTRCFGLQPPTRMGTKVLQGATMDDIGPIAVLDEDLQQADRYVDIEFKAKSPL